jgi:translation initiation factor 5A
MESRTPIAAGQIKKGMHAILKERPCKIQEVSVSKTGKHGHAKAHFKGEDVFTGRKYEDICPTTHTMYQPVLAQTVFDLMDIDEDNYLSLMSEDGTTREDLQLPEGELGQQIRESFDNDQDLSLTVLSWVDIEEAVISFKNAK